MRVLVPLLALVGLLSLRAEVAPTPRSTAAKEPVALVVVDDGKRAVTANRSGSASVVDLATGKVEADVPLGRKLADVAEVDGKTLLAVDEAAGELLIVTRTQAEFGRVRRVPVGRGPVCVRPCGTGSCAVANLWDRNVAIVALGDSPRVVRTVSLSFNPRLMLPLPDGSRLVVADAFGGRIAVVDADRGGVASTRTVPGSNLRGLALAPGGKALWVAQVVVSPDVETTRDNLHWGNAVTGVIREVLLADVLDPGVSFDRRTRVFPLDVPGRGPGDPSGLAVAADGVAVVALGGTGEVAIGPVAAVAPPRSALGRHPTAVAVSPDGKTAYTVDPFADSLTAVTVADRTVRFTANLGQPASTPAARGERLFYDARLSNEGWMSCHTCHPDGHTSGLRADTPADDGFGAPKRIPTLLGTRDAAPWNWSGKSADLAGLIGRTVAGTMHGRELSADRLADLEAYLRTLDPPPPATRTASARGKELFEHHGCAACHNPATAYTSGKGSDVGLADELGTRRFHPPSLRGVGQGSAFYHDGRAKTLEDVFTTHPHAKTGDVPAADRAELLRFLRGL